MLEFSLSIDVLIFYILSQLPKELTPLFKIFDLKACHAPRYLEQDRSSLI
jgi:hypothetical protein